MPLVKFLFTGTLHEKSCFSRIQKQVAYTCPARYSTLLNLAIDILMPDSMHTTGALLGASSVSFLTFGITTWHNALLFAAGILVFGVLVTLFTQKRKAAGSS